MPQFNTRPELALQAVAQQQASLLDPMEAQAKAFSLREMLDRQRDRGMQREARQQQMAERRLVAETLGKYGGDVDKAMPELAGKVSPETQQGLLELQKTARSSQKEALSLAREKGQVLAGIIAAGKGMSPEQYQQEFPKLRAAALRVAPDLQLPDFVPQEELDGLGLGLLTQDMVFGAAEEAHKAAKRPDELRKGKAEADRGEAEAQKSALEAQALKSTGGMTPAQQEIKYRSILIKHQAGEELSPEDIAFANGYAASQTKTTTSSDVLGFRSSSTSGPPRLSSKLPSRLRSRVAPSASTAAPLEQQLSGEAYLQSLNPATRAMVKGLAEYKQDPSRLMYRHPEIVDAVHQYDPSYDASQYASRAQLRKDFTSGKGANNIRSLNTAIGHLETLSKAAKELDNSPIQLWNRIANEGLTQTGDPRVVKFNNAANAVAGELATIFKNTSGTDQEIQSWREQFSAAQSPEQLNKGIAQLIELLSSRMEALAGQWESGMGKPKDFRLLNDKSAAILKKLGEKRMLELDRVGARGERPAAQPQGGDPLGILK